jgi:hypothetical protein
MRVPRTAVANAQILSIKVSNVNGGSGSSTVPFDFADVDASR